ncbi:methylmalonyl-CoA mutase subunit beta [Aureivirga sp. CE67]|uniref:methylmalonyl-CoA mutase subunit beta n=1 Tax=Aureivirga sp. CE67 TaxID=1788983 RepID=UPI0018C94CCD|nr:methylmalonyl-CoA mutase subunit beta [Aureivirga sp. CE67]
MSDFLFNEFEPSSAAAWKQKIQVDLKGADYNDTLLWHSREGITVKPFYFAGETESFAPETKNKAYEVCQEIYISDEKTANFLANDALQRGATSIIFKSKGVFVIEDVLKDIPEQTKIQFQLQFLDVDFYKKLIDAAAKFILYLNLDVIYQLATSGNWFASETEDFKNVATILEYAKGKNVFVLGVNAELYQNSGATTMQQIAYALAQGTEYLEKFGAVIANNIQFNFAVGSNYFFEIAKIRAFKNLWNTILAEYNTTVENIEVFVTPSLRNKTLYDYNVNMLRTTTECMSAILGGATTVSNIAYDAIFHKKNEFGERISRNQLLILKEESYFENAQNFADGAYYIESLTEQLMEKALYIFKQIEESGGFIKQLFKGNVQRKIAESAFKEQADFDNGSEILLGTNKYPNPKDFMSEDLELYPFLKSNKNTTVITPIIRKRLSQKMEKERLEAEKVNANSKEEANG